MVREWEGGRVKQGMRAVSCDHTALCGGGQTAQRACQAAALPARTPPTHPPLLPETAFNAILPPKADITLWKLSNRCQAWAVAGVPLFFDLDGRGGALLPTVYALWASPVPLVPEIVTHSEVSPKVLGGADLFLQGFVVPPHGLPRVLAGDLAVVRVPGPGSRPFALGVMETGADDAVAAGMKGKGVKLLHHYPDALWAFGDKRVPGPEFTPGRVWPAGEGPGGWRR